MKLGALLMPSHPPERTIRDGQCWDLLDTTERESDGSSSAVQDGARSHRPAHRLSPFSRPKSRRQRNRAGFRSGVRVYFDSACLSGPAHGFVAAGSRSGQAAIIARPTPIPIDTSTNRCNAATHAAFSCDANTTIARAAPAKR